VDNDLPEVTIVTRPANPSNSSSAAFDFDSVDTDVVGFRCKLDKAPGDNAWHECAASHVIPSLVDGVTYTLEVKAVDSAGNESPALSHTWLVDLTAPTTDILSKPEPFTSLTTATFEFSSGEANAQFECSFDGSAFTSCASPASYSTDTNKVYTFLVRARDAAGNLDPSPASYMWTVNRDVDTVIVKRPKDYISGEATFEFSSNLSDATYQCLLDDAADFSPCATAAQPTYTLAGLSDGLHTLRVRAVDREGKFDTSEPTATWVMDTKPPTPPAVTSPGPQGGHVNSRTPVIAGTATESEGLVTIFINGVLRGTIELQGTTQWTFSQRIQLEEGPYSIRATHTDFAGNTSSLGPARTVTIDTLPPEPAFAVTPGALTSARSFTFQMQAGEPVFYECNLDSLGFKPCDASFPVNVLDGRHTLVVQARDYANNYAINPISHIWDVDATPPTIRIASGPKSPNNSREAILTFSASEAGVRYECSLDGAAFSSCDETLRLVELSEGAHSLELSASDPAGNVVLSKTSHTWTVDVTAPGAPVVASPLDGAVVGSRIPAIQGTAEPDSQVIIFFDGQASAPVQADATGKWRFSPAQETSDGSHTVVALSRDAAGNESERSTSISFVVDPSINIVHEIDARGGGLNCSTSRDGQPSLAWLGVIGLALLVTRRRLG
jgi:MYXO-CTERM domain-containing protein